MQYLWVKKSTNQSQQLLNVTVAMRRQEQRAARVIPNPGPGVIYRSVGTEKDLCAGGQAVKLDLKDQAEGT